MEENQIKEILITDEFIPDYSLSKEEREKQIQEYKEELKKTFDKLGL